MVVLGFGPGTGEERGKYPRLACVVECRYGRAPRRDEISASGRRRPAAAADALAAREHRECFTSSYVIASGRR